MMITVNKGDIATIDGVTGVVTDFRHGSNGYVSIQLDPAAIRANLPDSAMLVLMGLAKGEKLLLKSGAKQPLITSNGYAEARIAPATFELIKPYLVENRTIPGTTSIEYKLNDEYWPDFVALRVGDLVEILVDDPLNRRHGRVAKVDKSGLYIGVEFDGVSGRAWLWRRSLRRVFVQSDLNLQRTEDK